MATERMVVWEGPSELDGSPLVVLATGLPKGKGRSSQNRKTGDMIQVWILRADMAPHVALKQGFDQAICGTCPHRGKASGGSGACYVNVGQGPRATWVSHQDKGSLPFDAERFRGHKVRFGAYGDPAAVPFEVWESIAEVAEGVTGYTHQWRTADPRFARYCMASADTVQERREARMKGYRTFRVRTADQARLQGEVSCPASEEAGKRTVCATCMACGGTDNGRKQDVTIIAHGATKSSFAPLSLSIA
ncbi:hypothetical protein PBI_RHYNO_74 [Mycobacterium phage RhynO]|uniref:hypothetical protein n=1 Tax=Mycobacterium phage RhynO TaxID=1458846 RepID=UPI0003F1D7A4|nr:hypothetical protein CG97_gp08 [Mycobacterium phage RhynO]AHJ88732.1 hypothetical protein PBI_RHYNO_74 [Mycobacterium phage RhynO]